MNRLVNITMSEAQPIADLAELIFPKVDLPLANNAVTVLMGTRQYCASVVAPSGIAALPGACLLSRFAWIWRYAWIPRALRCLSHGAADRAGKLYAQPREKSCDCGARVFELFTCRNCGTAYARAYTDDVDNPQYLWAEAGSVFRTLSGQLSDLLPFCFWKSRS